MLNSSQQPASANEQKDQLVESLATATEIKAPDGSRTPEPQKKENETRK